MSRRLDIGELPRLRWRCVVPQVPLESVVPPSSDVSAHSPPVSVGNCRVTRRGSAMAIVIRQVQSRNISASS